MNCSSERHGWFEVIKHSILEIFCLGCRFHTENGGQGRYEFRRVPGGGDSAGKKAFEVLLLTLRLKASLLQRCAEFVFRIETDKFTRGTRAPAWECISLHKSPYFFKCLKAYQRIVSSIGNMYSIFLDTNIYRSLGLRFAKHRDYESMHKFLEMSGHSLGLLGVVKRELLDYYQKEVFDKAVNDYHRALKQIENNPFLQKLPVPIFTAMVKEANRILEIDLDVFMHSEVRFISSEDLTRFLLFNKSQKRGDNARDFLIFYNLLEICTDDKERTIVLISQDKIFRENSFFMDELQSRKITNLKVYESIPEFMALAGTKVEWLTREILKQHINEEVIYLELLNDVSCLPSYISHYYSEKDDEDLPSLKKLVIQSVCTEDFYVYRTKEDNQLHLNVDLRVRVFALFGPDPYPDQLKAFLTSKPLSTIQKPETFDEKGNLIYNEDILFLFSGLINETDKKIEYFQFTDFMPSIFRYENWTPGLAYELKPVNNESIQIIEDRLPS